MFMHQDQNTALDPRWQTVLRRDRDADGTFVYAVRSTGVYCRPSCASRRAKPENVSFFPSPEAAEAQGFRPCLRCHPRGQSPAEANAALIAAACRMIEESEEVPSTEALARRIGLSTFHFHRQFKALTGLTPRGYASAHRGGRLREALASGASVTAAIHEAGFGSASRFYETAESVIGMSPSAFRKGGAEAEIRFALAQCSLGAILVASTEKGLCAISLGDEPEPLLIELQNRFPQARLIGGDAAFEALVARVVAFVEAPGTGLDLPLDIRGTAFQQRVWQALRDIRAGETVSYAELAARIGDPKAVRAVAGACAANTLAVAIPCHRVVRSDGAISGYRWGVARKREILDREARG
ncbi:MAG TPA: bifunctional DNA-binding transcriptional regulator/O6-methylguanine-DNA methyltransferase Ada [Paracoccus sp. (in: a-proteobacteria)]|uniref:bifunctional DNA-binding transcriptional regulator/O6-methylguanine-DNA methyltransferase Ada n=1 Tax=Paracoccus sp. TaxID=267 RepID=UPI002C18F14E|nr:bifunctional DNA-binding transcriptional regulator/O6-methylguanine-DNA methyltransferase Ada [Paracoccus sp. (in: a-proteobacteria)]HWL57033.1 bifunctional DNA-binding transcriptional regulator/O6-methylguanine-DNA methyltransferase Ada [Paracoccus sp. (in: a-proteobacteria)]